MLEHLHEFPIGHHGFGVSPFDQFLLQFEARALVERIVELGPAVQELGAAQNELHAQGLVGICRIGFGQRRDELGLADEPNRPDYLSAAIFPERIDETFSICSFVGDFE